MGPALVATAIAMTLVEIMKPAAGARALHPWLSKRVLETVMKPSQRCHQVINVINGVA